MTKEEVEAIDNQIMMLKDHINLMMTTRKEKDLLDAFVMAEARIVNIRRFNEKRILERRQNEEY